MPLRIFLTLITLFAMGAGEAWAEEVTATWDFTTMANGVVNIQSGIKFGAIKSDVGGIVLAVEANGGKLASGGGHAQFNDNTIIRVPVVAVGDIVTVNAHPGYHYYTIAGVNASKDSENYTATADDVAVGYVEVRSTGSAYLYSITVVQNPSYPMTATWDFTKSGYPAEQMQGYGYGCFANSGNHLVMEVDAKNGKFYPRGTDAQVNATTIFKIPVASTKDIITITNYSESSNNATYSIGGESGINTPQVRTFNPSKADVTTGYTIMTVTGNGYIRGISVEQKEKEIITDPQMGLSTSSVNVYAPSYIPTSSATVTLTGSNLTDGTYQVTQPSVTGLTITPTQFTVADGAVNQTFTISYNSAVAVASANADFTFATSDQDMSVTVTATYGKTVKRDKSPITISEETTWDFNGAATQDITLSGSTSPTSNQEFIYTSLGEVKESTSFDAMTVKGQYAYYQGTSQVNELKFTTTVPGKVKVKFNAGTTSHTSELYVNNVATGATSNNYDYVEKEVDVPAGDVVLTGKTGGNATQLRFSKVIFTPSAPSGPAFEDFKIDFRVKASDEKRYTVTLPDNGELPECVKLTNLPSTNGGQHGLNQGAVIAVHVDGRTQFTIGGCDYSEENGVSIKVGDNDAVTINTKIACENSVSNIATATYTSNVKWTYDSDEPADITFTFTGAYLPYFFGKALTVNWSPTWNSTESRWEVKQGETDAENGESLIAALEYVASQSNKTLYIPNGTYDLGTAHNTPVAAGMTLIGESENEVFIHNQPEAEGIGVTATLQINGTGVSLQNMILKCRAPYNNNQGAERGVCVQDKGNGTRYSHVTMDGLQDTYYSNGPEGMTAQFDDCTIMGTVDFICGNGDITFNNCTLKLAKPHNGGNPVIAAPATYTTETKGYIFNNCTIDVAPSSRGNAYDCITAGHSSEAVTDFSYARAWYAGNGDDRTPRVSFRATTSSITSTANWGTPMNTPAGGDISVFEVLAEIPEPTPEPEYPKTATWDFTVNPYPTEAIEGKIAYLASNRGTQLDMDVIATPGKLSNNGSWAQFNLGTILRVPVVSLQDEVTVVAYEDAKTSIAGIPMASKRETYTAQPEDVARGYVEITATANTYLGSVSVTQYEAVTGVVMATWDWKNKIPVSIVNTNIQKASGEVEGLVQKGGATISFEENRCKLKINKDDHADASVIKLQYRSSNNDAQFNARTKLQIPVFGRGDIIAISYRSNASYKINDSEVFTESKRTYIATSIDAANKHITLEQVTKSGYLYSITLIHTQNVSGHTVYTEISPANAGTVKQTPAGGIEDGHEVTLTATPKTGYKFVNWTDNANGDAVLGSELIYRTTVTSDLDIRANFEKMFTMSFDNNDKQASGAAPKDVISNEGRVTIPTNHTIYKAGYTLTGWTDGETTYLIGQEYTLTKDVTVHPVFTMNTKKITDAKAATTVRWDFDRVRTGTDYNFGNGTAGTIVSQATVGDQKIDLLMEKGGQKLDNRDDGVLGNANASGTQMNDDCTLTIPAVYGMTVTIKAAEMHDTRNGGDVYTRFNAETIKTTIAGGKPTVDDDRTATYTYNGDEKTITINIHSENAATYGFFDWIEVQYPPLAELTLTVTPDENAIDEGSPAGTVAITPDVHGNTDGKYPVNENLTLTATPEYAYAFGSWEGATPDQEHANVATLTMSSDKAVTATFTKLPTYTFSVVSDNKKHGTAANTPVHKEYSAGTVLTLTAQPALGYVLDGWYNGLNKLSEENPYEYTTTDANVVVTAKFMESLEKHDAVFTHLDDPEIQGDYPSDVLQKAGLNLPKYHTLYKPGYTLTAWVDGSGTEYAPGTPITMTGNMTFEPKFTQNDIHDRLDGRSETAELYWDFRTEAFAQTMSYATGQNLKYATRAYVKGDDGNTHDFDVLLSINTGSRGKIENTSSDEWCTIGRATVLTVPSCYGATIEMEVRKPIVTTTFAGTVPTLVKVKYVGDDDYSTYDPNDTRSVDTYIYNKVCDGDEATADIVVGTDYSFYRYLKVTLPSQQVEHEVALVNTDWTNWDAAIEADGYSGGHEGASTLPSESFFTTHFTKEKKTVTAREVTVNKGKYSDMFGSRDNLSGYLTFSDKSGADAPRMTMSEFKNVTRIKLRQGARVPYGSGIKVTAIGIPVGETERTEKVVSGEDRSTYPEWVEMDVNMNQCTIVFENITSTESNKYHAYMYDLIIYGEASTTSSQMKLHRSVNEAEAGKVDVYPEYNEYPKVDETGAMLQYDDLTPLTLTAVQNDGWEFVKWVEIDAEGNTTDLSTQNPYNFTITSNRNIQAVYKRVPFFTFTFGGHNYSGSVPSAQQITPAGGFTIPYNRTLYKDDNSTLVGWEMTQYDGVTKHQFDNKAIAVSPQTYKSGDAWYNENLFDINLAPVIKDNTVSLLDIDQKFTEGVKVRWYFGLPNGAPELNIENRVGFLMSQAQVTDDEFIDLRMYIDALNDTGRGKGKVNNVGRWQDNWAQVNPNTLFTIPATKGMKLEIKASNAISNTTFGGEKPTTTGTTAEWIYTGSEDHATVDVYDGSYYDYIEATYYPRLSKPTIRMKEMGNETISLTIKTTANDPYAKTYYSIDGGEPTILVTDQDGIITFDNPDASITVKAITISDNRPDSEVESYMVAPYSTGKRTVMYLYNGEQPGYSINNDIMYRTLMFGAANGYAPVHESGCNVLAHDVSTPSYDVDETPDGQTKIYYANSNMIFVAPDGLLAVDAPLPGIADSKKEKTRRYIADITGHDHVVITPMTVIGQLLGRIPTASDLTDGIVTVPSGKDNLRMLDYVLMDKDNKICVSWTGNIAVNDLTLNAAYMLANSVKTIVEHYNGTNKAQTDIVSPATAMTYAEELNLIGTLTTPNPQLRNQRIVALGRDQGDAKPIELADLVDGEMHIVLPKLPNSPSAITAEAWVNGALSTSDDAGKVTVEKDQDNVLNTTLTLTGNGQERKYKIFASLDSKSDELIFTSDGNNVDERYWSNDVWKVSQKDGFVSGNNGDVFKFNINNDDVITISGPANYAIKSIDFVGYQYVSGGNNGETSTLTYEFVNQPYVANSASNKITSDWKIYDLGPTYVDIKGSLKAEFGLYSINTVSFKLNETATEKKNGQAIGRFIVEYYLRESSSMSLTNTNTPDNAVKEHNGAITLEFTSLMGEVGSDAGVKLTPNAGGEDIPLAANGNSQALAFTYWDIAPGNYTLTIPFSALKDVDGNVFTGLEADGVSGRMTKSGDSYVVPVTFKAPEYAREVFDFIVNGIDHGTTWDGTFIDGLNLLGDNTGERKRMLFLNYSDRYFIAPGTPENHENGTSTKFTDADGKELGGDRNGNQNALAYNSHTRLTAKNLSLIGESLEGVVIANKPELESMSTTPTIEFKTKDCTDNYMQDITIRNEYDYNGGTGRATAFYDSGFNTIMKNVRLESYQDTYFTNGNHTYAENCTFMGVVDFIYGHGDHWYENCKILLRNRNGNNIVAPSTSPSEKWGYVFNNCTIDKEEGATLVTDHNWTLARPWQNSPATTFLSTKMNVLPNNIGYAAMSSLPLIIRFHEYGTKDKNGSSLDIAQRSIAICAPAAGSDSPILTVDQANIYSMRTVIGGNDGYDPSEYTKQVDRITSLYVDGQGLYWKDRQEALCYFIYYLGDGNEPNDDPVLVANIAPEYTGAEASFNLFQSPVFRATLKSTFVQWYAGLQKGGKIMKTNDEFTHGWFAVRAANQRGGLNEMSNAVEYHKVHEYLAAVSAAGKATDDDSGNVWSTVYLDFNAKAPLNVKAYALSDVTAFGGVDVTETTVHLKRVSINETTAVNQDIVYANMGYVLYGPGPNHATMPMQEYHFIETGHMNIIDDSGEEESRTAFTKSYLRGTVGEFKGTISGGAVGELGDRGWSSYPSDYNNVPVGYTTAYTLATKTVENTSFGLGFYKYTGTTFGHHKAYLDTDDVSDLLKAHGVAASSLDQILARAFVVVLHDFDDTVTGVFLVEDNKFVDINNAIYNIQGIKVRPDMMHKGDVYIINGKKIRY